MFKIFYDFLEVLLYSSWDDRWFNSEMASIWIYTWYTILLLILHTYMYSGATSEKSKVVKYVNTITLKW